MSQPFRLYPSDLRKRFPGAGTVRKSADLCPRYFWSALYAPRSASPAVRLAPFSQGVQSLRIAKPSSATRAMSASTFSNDCPPIVPAAERAATPRAITANLNRESAW